MRKAFSFLKNLFVWAVVAIAVFMMFFTIISVTTVGRNDRNLFGYRFYIVLTDSMSASDINAGDIVVIKEADPATLQVGDIIAFTSRQTESYGQTITHMIREITVDENGNPAFVTYGTTTDTNDELLVTYPYVLGKLSFTMPKLGVFFQFLKTVPGYFLCIFLPFMILIMYQGVNCVVLFRRYRSEQMEEMESERLRLEEERRKSAEMMAELMALKEQLAGQTAAEKPAETPTEE